MEQRQETPDLDLKSLNQFTGTQHYYNVFGVNVTDGIKYLMDNGYSWFVTDSIAVLRGHPDKRLRSEPFLVIRLKLDMEKHEGTITIDDGNDNLLYSQHYGYTDAKREVKMYYENEVLCLPSER